MTFTEPVVRVLEQMQTNGLEPHHLAAEAIATWSKAQRLQPKPEPKTSKGFAVSFHVKGLPDWATPFKMFSNGKGLIPVSHLRRHRPFNSETIEKELIVRMEKAPGKWKMNSDFPEVDLGTLDEAGVTELCTILDFIQSEVRRIHTH